MPLSENDIGDAGGKALAQVLSPRQQPDLSWSFPAISALWLSGLGPYFCCDWSHRVDFLVLAIIVNVMLRLSFSTGADNEELGEVGVAALAQALYPKESAGNEWVFNPIFESLYLTGACTPPWQIRVSCR